MAVEKCDLLVDGEVKSAVVGGPGEIMTAIGRRIIQVMEIAQIPCDGMTMLALANVLGSMVNPVNEYPSRPSLEAVKLVMERCATGGKFSEADQKIFDDEVIRIVKIMGGDIIPKNGPIPNRVMPPIKGVH